MKSFIQKYLASCARKVIAKEKPAIIAVTGSVGKSSTKEAIAVVLRAKFFARSSPGNYNTEFGLPLAALGLSAPKNAFGWISTSLAACRAASGGNNFPKMLVLEMAADRVGDIAQLCDIAPPDVAVVTAIGESHLELFGTVENIVKEKRIVVERLGRDGVAVLNRDDEKVWEMRSRTKAKVRSYGFHPDADVRALEPIGYACAFDAECGMHFKISAGGATVPVFLPGVLGRAAISAALAEAAVGLEKGMNLVEIGDALRTLRGVPGRMRYIAGIKHTVLIDDTYNAAPRSAIAALEVLREIPLADGKKRFAVLGDMLELGALSEEGHARVGSVAAACADVLVFIGERMTAAEKSARDAGVSEDRVFHFSGNEEAGRFVQERIHQGDIALIKGSRGMHMEEIVKELMAEPLEASTLLVGGHDEWKP